MWAGCYCHLHDLFSVKDYCMTDNYEHFISRNIAAFYRRRIGSPLTYLALLALLWLIFPLKEMIFPHQMAESEKILSEYHSADTYVHGTFTDLTFSGFTRERFGKTSGYYYYGIRGSQPYIILLTPSACEEGIPHIDSITVSARLMQGKETYQDLLTRMAEDLDWSVSGIEKQLPKYYLSQPDYHLTGTRIFLVFYLGTIFYTLICLMLYLIYMHMPILSPTCLDLAIFGHPIEILEEAEEELATLPQLATEDMFITEHYFILSSPYGNAIVPIHEILWIYKYSTLHKFLWYYFSISYTLHITANKHFFVKCPKNLKSDIDGIIDYLAEANHNILVGFSEENRVKVQKAQARPFHLEKLIALLRRKV